MSSSGKHGPTWQTWRSMIARCKTTANRNYGGRGIKVCERWKSFENFYADMGPRPDGLTIDRINTNGNYEPGNCRWATAKQQSRNTRANVVYEHGGREVCIAELAETVGIAAEVVRSRLAAGWSLDRAIRKDPGVERQPLTPYQPLTPLEICMLDFQRQRQALHAIGLTADEIANRKQRRAA